MKHVVEYIQAKSGGTLVPVSGASVQVNLHGGGAATIYSDDGVTTTINPLTTDSNGKFEFYAANTRYDYVVSGTGVTTTTFSDQQVFDATEILTADGSLKANQLQLGAGGLSVTGTTTLSNTTTIGGGTVASPTGILTLGGGSPWYDVTAPPWNAVCNDNGTGNGTDDTAAIQSTITTALTTGGIVYIPENRFCKITSALSFDGGIHTGLISGVVTGRNRNGSVASRNAGLVFTGSSGSAITAKSSAGVVIRTSIYLTNASYNGILIDTSHATSSDTQYFALEDSVIVANTTSCATGVSLDKTINSRVINNAIFGCVEQIRGAATSGNYSVRNTIRGNDFQPASNTTVFIANPGGSWTVSENDFEIGSGAVSTFKCTDTFTGPVTSLLFSGNFDGDATSNPTRTRYDFSACTTAVSGISFIGNTIGGNSANDKAFNFPNSTSGVVIQGNDYRNTTWGTFLTLGTSTGIVVAPHDYSTVTISSFRSGTPANGYIWDNSGVLNIWGQQANFIDANKTMLGGGSGNNTFLSAASGATVFIGDTAQIAQTGGAATLGATSLGGVTNAKGLQLFNTTTTCTTGASIGATCTTAAISLPVAEADTSYRVSCTGKGLTNVPVVIATTNSSASQFTITIAALTAAAASFTSFDCVAGHS